MTRTPMRRVLRSARVVAALVVAATLLDGGQAARAQANDATVAAPLGGYQGTAAASGVHLGYVPRNLLPFPSLIDIGAPDALATITSGPVTFARASVADPGDLIANPGALLAIASDQVKPGTIPPYPYRITASSTSGTPKADVTAAPGLDAHVVANPSDASASANLPTFTTPGVLTFGSVTTTATTTTDGSKVTVHARTSVTGIDLLGLVTIDSLVTDVSATSAGTATTLSGGTTVVGASIGGQPVTIDADGVHVSRTSSGDPGAGLLAPLATNLNQLLAGAGIRITLAGPVRQGAGTVGQLGAAGLRVDLDVSSANVPGLTALLNALPPIDNPVPGAPGIEDVLQVVRTHQIADITIGRGEVSLAARSSVVVPTVPVPSSFPTVDTGLPAIGVGGFPLPETPVAVVADRTGTAPLVPVAAHVPDGTGIAGAVLLALLCLPLVGERLAAGARALLGTGAPDRCTWEEP